MTKNFSRALFLLLGFLVANAPTSKSQAAFFNLRGVLGTELEGSLSSSVSVGGITATLTANSGVFNQSSIGFGVNAIGGADDAARLDGDVLAETITLTFNIDVFLEQIQLSVLSPGEEGALTIAGGAPVSLVDTGGGADEYDFSTSNTVLTTESVVLAWVSGNGFSFDDFTVTPLVVLDGDFDADGDRDGSDFLVWQRDMGDASNLTKWKNNFGAPASHAAITFVPEPTGLLLALAATALGLPLSRKGRIQ